MARFFIDRPVFAWVIAIIIMLAGVLAVTQLPISRYPDIAPPSVTVNATYPGASAQAVENSVTQVIEQAMTGLDGLQYMASTSDASGAVAVTLTFANGTDPDIAQVQVQNKLQVANRAVAADRAATGPARGQSARWLSAGSRLRFHRRQHGSQRYRRLRLVKCR